MNAHGWWSGAVYAPPCRRHTPRERAFLGGPHAAHPAPPALPTHQMAALARSLAGARRMGGAADPAWSLRRLREEHDRLAREHARRSADPKPFAVPWRCEIDGFAFTRLVSAADFAEEGAIMRHCIASYARDAKSGRETAFRIEGPERASVSFATSGHVEIRGRLNARVTEPCRRAAMKAWATFKAEPSTPR